VTSFVLVEKLDCVIPLFSASQARAIRFSDGALGRSIRAQRYLLEESVLAGRR
jgi:hypothetical protein